MLSKYGPLLIELVFDISIEYIFDSKILSTTVSFISVPILKISFSSGPNFISLCKNFPYNESFDTSMSFRPSLDNFFALRKLIFSPDLITTLPDFASTTSCKKISHFDKTHLQFLFL